MEPGEHEVWSQLYRKSRPQHAKDWVSWPLVWVMAVDCGHRRHGVAPSAALETSFLWSTQYKGLNQDLYLVCSYNQSL